MSMRVVSTLWRTWSRPVVCGTFPNACMLPTYISALLCVCMGERVSALVARLQDGVGVPSAPLVDWWNVLKRRSSRRTPSRSACFLQMPRSGRPGLRLERTGGEGGDKGGLGDGSAPPAVVGGGVVVFPDTRGRLGGVGGGGPAVAGDWRLGITYDGLLARAAVPGYHRFDFGRGAGSVNLAPFTETQAHFRTHLTEELFRQVPSDKSFNPLQGRVPRSGGLFLFTFTPPCTARSLPALPLSNQGV